MYTNFENLPLLQIHVQILDSWKWHSADLGSGTVPSQWAVPGYEYHDPCLTDATQFTQKGFKSGNFVV
jgi:hypothetical protein